MFNSLTGIVNGKTNESIYLLCGSIEWDISMPSNDIHELLLNKEYRIFTWLYHREDQMRLYGFSCEQRRLTFLELLKVDGIGPKGAIKILSGISQDDLTKALETGDLARLEVVPGLGKKTAQKMILTLKGKLITKEIPAVTTAHNDLVEALSQMGYERRAVQNALVEAEKNIDKALSDEEKEKQLFKEAIVYLSGVGGTL